MHITFYLLGGVMWATEVVKFVANVKYGMVVKLYFGRIYGLVIPI
jgi:hypothetical protein